jgi:hypothetical protein
MRRSIVLIILGFNFSILPSVYSQKLRDIQELSTEQIETTYQILKDVSYGSDPEQNMNIYLFKQAESYGKGNFTLVFLHGGGYYFSDKSQEERYIEPYLKKGLNVVNLNYRLKRGISIAKSDLTKAERDSSGDSLISLEERYGGKDSYMENVIAETNKLLVDRLLTQQDADKIIADAKAINWPPVILETWPVWK